VSCYYHSRLQQLSAIKDDSVHRIISRHVRCKHTIAPRCLSNTCLGKPFCLNSLQEQAYCLLQQITSRDPAYLLTKLRIRRDLCLTLQHLAKRSCRGRQTSPPAQPPDKPDETYSSSLILAQNFLSTFNVLL